MRSTPYYIRGVFNALLDNGLTPSHYTVLWELASNYYEPSGIDLLRAQR